MLLKIIKQKREDERKQMRAEAAKKAGIAFAVGSVIGTVTALFTAPKSGKELRKDVKNTAVAGADKVKEGAEVLAVKTAEAFEDTVEFGKSVKSKIQTISKKKPIEQIESDLEDTIEEASDLVEDAAEALEDEIKE